MWPRGNTRVEDTGIIDPNKRQKDENGGGRQELEKMLEQRARTKDVAAHTSN